MVIAYRVPTSTIANEDIIRRYKSEMIRAIDLAGRNAGYIPDLNKVIIKALPFGTETVIKAYYKLSDAIGGRKAPITKQDQSISKTIPKEGLFILEG